MSSHLPPNTTGKKSNLGKGLLIGCLGALFLAALIIGGTIYWLYNNGRALISDTTRDAFIESVEQSELPADQKEGIVEQINRLTEGFKEGRIDVERMAAVIERISNSSIFSVILLKSVEGAYLRSSGLSQKEKEAARVHLDRFARGVIENRIPEEQADSVLSIISEPAEGPQDRKLSLVLTDEQIRAFVSAAKEAADNAGVSEREIETDLAAELKSIVDEALNETAAAE